MYQNLWLYRVISNYFVFYISHALFQFFYSTDTIPAVTALAFCNNLSYGVGMSTGQVLLYDIRTNRPYRVKDHMYELPIKNIEFLGDHVLSMDASILKIWKKETV